MLLVEEEVIRERCVFKITDCSNRRFSFTQLYFGCFSTNMYNERFPSLRNYFFGIL